MTLPTYVNKARARRTVRTIELTGISSSGHDETDSTWPARPRVGSGAARPRSSEAATQGRRRLTHDRVDPRFGVRAGAGGNFFLALKGAWGCGAVGSASRSQ